MQYILLPVVFMLFVLIMYPITPFVEAQSRERCDAAVCHVEITEDGFVPKALIVKIGTTIVWTNNDDSTHTVTSGSPGEIVAPLKSPLLKPSETYEFTFHHFGLYQGSYKYFDQVTLTMRGEIIVEQEPEKIEEPPKANTMNVDFNDPQSGVKKVSFAAGTIKNMEIDLDFLSLVINVDDVRGGGKLTLVLDRTLIDSKSNGKDDRFIVLVDGEEGFHEELSSTPTERTLEIVVPDKTTRIEIVGTKVIPEFPVAMLVIASVFTAMIAAYRLRTRFNQI